MLGPDEASVEIPTIVELNVGGVIYTTRLSTLLRYPSSMLAIMFGGRFAVCSPLRLTPCGMSSDPCFV
jgi:hypothetical protein